MSDESRLTFVLEDNTIHRYFANPADATAVKVISTTRPSSLRMRG